jgi:hypothetical protein
LVPARTHRHCVLGPSRFLQVTDGLVLSRGSSAALQNGCAVPCCNPLFIRLVVRASHSVLLLLPLERFVLGLVVRVCVPSKACASPLAERCSLCVCVCVCVCVSHLGAVWYSASPSRSTQIHACCHSRILSSVVLTFFTFLGLEVVDAMRVYTSRTQLHSLEA